MKQPTGALTCAAYLRCYPRDAWAMMGLQSALERHALVLGLPIPVAYIDNGCPSGASAPGRTKLDRAVAEGWISVVLVPGPWVFALNDVDARRAVEEFTEQGCEVIELPRVERAAPDREHGLHGGVPLRSAADLPTRAEREPPFPPHGTRGHDEPLIYTATRMSLIATDQPRRFGRFS